MNYNTIQFFSKEIILSGSVLAVNVYGDAAKATAANIEKYTTDRRKEAAKGAWETRRAKKIRRQIELLSKIQQLNL